MLALRLSPPPTPFIHLSKPNPLNLNNTLSLPPLYYPRIQFRVYAENNRNKADENGIDNEKNSKNGSNNRLRLNLLNLVLDPDPENVVAVGLTGLLTWASVQVLWQLVVVSAAIVIAAVKYSVVAALLLFILITLL